MRWYFIMVTRLQSARHGRGFARLNSELSNGHQDVLPRGGQTLRRAERALSQPGRTWPLFSHDREEQLGINENLVAHEMLAKHLEVEPMKVEQIMTQSVKTCRADDSLHAAAQVMWDADCGFVPVVDDERRLIGALTDRDICMAALFRNLPLGSMSVGSTMSCSVACCRLHDRIEDAENLMRTRQVHRLPVTENEDRLVGILSLNDILLEAARERGDGGAREVGAELIAETLAEISAHRQSGPIATTA